MPNLYLKTAFTVTIPLGKHKISESNFGNFTSGWYPAISLLIPAGIPKLEGKLDDVQFHLTSESFVSGTFACEVKDKNGFISCDAIFKINVKSDYSEAFLNPESKWALSRVHVPSDMLIPSEKFISSTGTNSYDAKYIKHFKNIEESDTFLIISVITGKSKKL